MGLLTFKGGIHPPHAKKYTEHKETIKAIEPSTVIIPMRQHIGAPCEASVAKGDYVKVGQEIGAAKTFVCAPIHSSVSGTVKDVKKMPVIGGQELCVIIESDGLNELHESVKPSKPLNELSKDDLIGIIKDKGIVGMGGAGFPTHVKLSPPPEKIVDVLIINAAECEPYLTADHRLMLEASNDIIMGVKALMKALAVEEAYIGIEDNKPDCIKTMSEAAKGTAIKVVGLKTKYPQGAEKQLIYACTKREVPSGGLPMDAGAVVNNVATAYALAKAITTGMPLVERICTISGKAVHNPQNMWIKVGTPLTEIVEQCGGMKDNVQKIIMGGPMMGMAQSNLSLPATKTTSGILLFDEEEAKMGDTADCIKCGKCVSICPAYLQPIYISAYALQDRFEKAAEYHALDCIECGSCSFVCPSNRPLLHSIRVAKREIMAARRKQK